MTQKHLDSPQAPRLPWWRSVGPALIMACVVFGPGSLVVSANVGATYGYGLLWFLAFVGMLMGVFMTMSARIGVAAGNSLFAALAQEAGRPFAALLGIVLCLTCGAFQFSNNLAIALVAGAFAPEAFAVHVQIAAMLALNAVMIVFLFRAQQLFKTIERVMKFMVGVILLSFLVNLFLARPEWGQVARGLIPGIPEGLSLGIPRIVEGVIDDPMVLLASLVGTTFSVAGAFFQANLVREKGWTRPDYKRGFGDAVAGVCVLTMVSMTIMITAGTVIRGRPADNMAGLAITLQPLLGPTAFVVFCIGLFPVAMNPFLVNAMIGGTALADGLGLPGKMNDAWPRRFTVVVLFAGFAMATAGLLMGIPAVNLMIVGQAITVIGNPLMAATMLWLANRRRLMDDLRNRTLSNILGALGLAVVLLMAARMLWFVYLRITLMTAAGS